MTEASGRTLAFGHVGLQVRDLERSRRYYRDVIGLVEIEYQVREEAYLQQLTGYPGVQLAIALFVEPRSGVMLELLEYRGVPGGTIDPATGNSGTAHVCFEVDDVDAIHAAALSEGHRSVAEPVTPTSGRWSGGRSVYLVDPDGIRVELVQRAAASTTTSSSVETESVFLVEVAFAAGAEERRKPHRAAHLWRIAELKRQGIVIEGGAYLDRLSTSIMLLRCSAAAEARQIVEDDVYWSAGVWENLQVRPFGRVVGLRPDLPPVDVPGER